MLCVPVYLHLLDRFLGSIPGLVLAHEFCAVWRVGSDGAADLRV